MRAVWTGEMGFGMIQIPIKLHSATKDLSPQFHQLHTECKSRINMVRRCGTCVRDIAWEEIGKGYEVSKGEYALFTKEELAALEDSESGSIEIVQFIDPNDIAPAQLEKSYWVSPGSKTARGARGFEILRTVLADTERAALVKVKLRTKPRLGIIRAQDKFFMLQTMRYADELVGSSDLVAPDVKPIGDREREMAEQLVDELTSPFDPAKHIDQYRAAVMAAADAKVAWHARWDARWNEPVRWSGARWLRSAAARSTQARP